MLPENRVPTHPGEILREDFLMPLGITQVALAAHLGMPVQRINEIVRVIIDEGTDPWGIEVTGVEIKDIDLPQEMKRAMAKQAEAERERRAKVISAEGELQASEKLRDAALKLSEAPAAATFQTRASVAGSTRK